MLKKIILPFLLLFLVSCDEDINVTIIKEPGGISGIVVPASSGATVELLQGVTVKETKINSSGIFRFTDVPAGVYTIRTTAANYGRKELEQITVKDGEGYDVGTIELSKYPFPLFKVLPNSSTGRISTRSNYLMVLEFSREMILDSLINSISTIPKIENLEISQSSSGYESNYRYYLSGDAKFGTEYTVKINSTAKTIFDEYIEFPYSFNFTTEYFTVKNFYHYNTGSMNRIRIDYNNFVGNNILDHITLEPATEIYLLRADGSTIEIAPSVGWKSDENYTLTIDKSYTDIEGNPMEKDEVFNFITQPFQILTTQPVSGQSFISTTSNIIITMNNVIDESTLANAISVNPNLNYLLTNLPGQGFSRIELRPDTLAANTKYTITIDSTLSDYYGKALKSPYTFSFKTN